MRYVKWLLSLLFIGLIALHTVPFVARDLIVWSLLQQGAEQVHLKKVRINWLSGIIALERLSIGDPKSPAVSVDTAQMDFYLTQLFQGRLHLSNLSVSDGQIHVNQSSGAFYIGSIELSPKDSDQSVDATQASPKVPLLIGLDNLKLNNLRLFYTNESSPELELELDLIQVANIYQWTPNQLTNIRLNGMINGSPINLNSDARPLPARKEFSVNLQLTELELGPISRLFDRRLKGRLNSDVNLNISFENNTLEATQKGMVEVEKLSYFDHERRFDMQRLRWQGQASEKIRFTTTSDQRPQIQLISTDFSLNSEDTQYTDVTGEFRIDQMSLSPNLTLDIPESIFTFSASPSIKNITANISNQQFSASDIDAVITGNGSLAHGNLPNKLISDLVVTTNLNLTELSHKVDSQTLIIDQLSGSPEIRFNSKTQLEQIQTMFAWQDFVLNRSGDLLSVNSKGGKGSINYGTQQKNLTEVSLTFDSPTLLITRQNQAVTAESFMTSVIATLDSDSKLTGLELDVSTSAATIKQPNIDGDLGCVRLQIHGKADNPDNWNTTTNLTTKDLQIKQDDLSLQLSKLSLAGPVAIGLRDDELEAINIHSPVKVEKILLTRSGEQIGIDSLNLTPDLNVYLKAGSVDGQLALQVNSLGAESKDIMQAAIASLTSDLKVGVKDATFELKGPVILNNGSFYRQNQQVNLASLHSNWNLHYSPPGVEWSTAVTLDDLRYSGSDNSLRIKKTEAQTQGLYLVTDDLLSFDLRGVKLSNLTSNTKHAGQLSISAAQIERFQTTTNNLAAKNITLINLKSQWPDEDKPLLAFDRLMLNRLNFSDNQLNLGRLTSYGTALNLEKSADGQLNLTRGVESIAENNGQPGKSESVSSSATPDSKLRFSLDHAEANQGLVLNYTDRSTDTPLSLELTANRLVLDNYKPGDSKPATLTFEGSINEQSVITFDASLQNTAKLSNGEWDGQIHQLSLPSISPIIQSMFGYQARSGTLELSSTGKIIDDQIDGNNHVKLTRFEVQRLENDRAALTDKVFTMPLSSAISLLENKDRTIVLDLPVSGDTADPRFSYQNIIQRVVTQGVKEGALALLSRSLQPYGALISIASAVADADRTGRFIKLQPMQFDNTESTLSAEAMDYGIKLAEMMKQRPGLSLEVCPVTVLREETNIQSRITVELRGFFGGVDEQKVKEKTAEAIKQLADERANNIHNYLTQHGIAANRLISCLARTGVTDGAPRVELAF